MDEAGAELLLDVVLYEAVADDGVDKWMNIPRFGFWTATPRA